MMINDMVAHVSDFHKSGFSLHCPVLATQNCLSHPRGRDLFGHLCATSSVECVLWLHASELPWDGGLTWAPLGLERAHLRHHWILPGCCVA